ncbi:hypothetical protein D3C71_1028650 [compost metagenome]
MITSEDYVGDTIEFINKQGLWFNRKLFKDSQGIYINYQGNKTRVKQWGLDGVGYRFRTA